MDYQDRVREVEIEEVKLLKIVDVTRKPHPAG
jgi:methyl coenzyme M reductase subunit C-like uncharacterized protein (methanogenesis marker protein 7)